MAISENTRFNISAFMCSPAFLTIVFILLRVFAVIDWPWIWVLCPLWISIGLSLMFLAVFTVVCVALAILFSEEP